MDQQISFTHNFIGVKNVIIWKFIELSAHKARFIYNLNGAGWAKAVNHDSNLNF